MATAKKKKAPAKKKAKKTAPKKDTIGKPHNWEKAVLSAYFYLRGDAQEACAINANVGIRSFKRWIKSDWWPEAKAQAKARWMESLDTGARRTLGKAMDSEDQPDLALRLLERLDIDLAPPKQQIEISQNFMARDEVVKLFRMFSESVAEIVDDPDKRKAIILKAQELLGPITAPGTPQTE